MSELCRRLAETTCYKCASVGLIFIQAFIVGLQAEGSNYPLLTADKVATCLFCGECLFIMAGYGKSWWWAYFVGLRLGKWESHAKWNCFSFTISYASLAVINMEGGAAVSWCRLLRITQILKAVFAREGGFIVIMEGLKKGMSTVTFVVTLLAFVLFLYGSCGVSIFGQNGVLLRICESHISPRRTDAPTHPMLMSASSAHLPLTIRRHLEIPFISAAWRRPCWRSTPALLYQIGTSFYMSR